MITLNTYGLLGRLYKFTYSERPDTNFCTFFWLILLAVIVYPLTTWSVWFDIYRAYRSESIVVRCVLGFATVTGIATGVALLTLIVPLIYYDFLQVVTILFGVFLGIAAAVAVWYTAGLIFGSKTAQEVKSVISTKRESFMDRYCPKIKWIN